MCSVTSGRRSDLRNSSLLLQLRDSGRFSLRFPCFLQRLFPVGTDRQCLAYWIAAISGIFVQKIFIRSQVADLGCRLRL